MQNGNNLLTTVILYSAVFAALISSLTNLFVSLLNNRRLKVIEKQRNLTEIDKYRYTQLYEILLNWYNYDYKIEGESPEVIAYYRLLDRIIENVSRYVIIRPLLDEQFTIELDVMKVKVDNLLSELIDAEKSDGTHTENFSDISNKYFKNGIEFSDKLKETIYNN